MPTFTEKVLDLAARTERNSAWRQRDCFNLIPSESTPSLLVKMCEIADPAGRYAEHRSMKGEEIYFYQGTDFIRDVEVECQKEMAAFFGCTDIELRPISGQMANEVVFKGLVKYLNRGRAEGQLSRRIRLVFNNELIYGGHLSSQPSTCPSGRTTPISPIPTAWPRSSRRTGPSSSSSGRACSSTASRSSSWPKSSAAGRTGPS